MNVAPRPEDLPPAPVTRFIVLSCALVAIGQVFLPMPLEALVIRALALVPAHLSASPLSMSPTLLTSLFVHGGWFHLLVNMMFLWLIGRPVEWVLGARRYLLLYLVTGIAGGGLQVALEPASTLPVVGASGAISGVLAVYAVLFSRSRVAGAEVLGMRLPGRYLQLLWFAASWIGIQVMAGMAFNSETGGIAIGAHIGGFLAGLLLIAPLLRPQADD